MANIRSKFKGQCTLFSFSNDWCDVLWEQDTQLTNINYVSPCSCQESFNPQKMSSRIRKHWGICCILATLLSLSFLCYNTSRYTVVNIGTGSCWPKVATNCSAILTTPPWFISYITKVIVKHSFFLYEQCFFMFEEIVIGYLAVTCVMSIDRLFWPT